MTQLLVILAVTLRIISNPLANVFQKKLTLRGQNSLFINFATYGLLSLACLFMAFDVSWFNLPKDFWAYSILGGAVGGLGNAYLVKAVEHGDLSVLGPVNSYKAVVAMIIGIFLLGEIPNLWGLAGVGLIIYGSYFVIGTMPEGFSWKVFKRKDIQYRLLAMVLTAIEAVFYKKVILASSATIAFIGWCFFGWLFSGIVLKIWSVSMMQELKKSNIKTFLYLILVVVCIGIMQLATSFSFEYIPVSYALAFFQLSVILSVFLGYKIFKETDIRKKLIGSVIMILGAIIIIFYA